MPKALLSLIVSAALIYAQQGSPETQVLRVTTRLVQVNVVVHDKKGEPVRDLTKDDFALYDKGQEQKILFFSRETSESALTDIPPLAKGIVSNRYSNFTSGGRTQVAALPTSLTVILLDGLNTSFTDQHYAREAIVKFLSQLQSSDRVAIYTLSNGLRVLHDFTSDTGSLLAALAKHRNQDSAALSASSYDDSDSGNDNIDAFLDRANERIATFYQTHQVEVTLGALQTIARHLSGMPGRKNLIWLSGGFPGIVGQAAIGQNRPTVADEKLDKQRELQPIVTVGQDFRTFSEEIQRALRTLNDVGLSIYPVDARGLMGPFATTPSMSTVSRAGARRPGPQPVDQRAQDQILQTQGTMQEIAERTGGRAFMNNNDLTGAIRRAMDDTRVSYTIAYTPSHNEWDGKFRDIKIKLNRPGLEARYRSGYFAYPDAPAADPKRRQAALMEAASTPLASTGLEIVATVVQKPTAEMPRVRVRVLMDPREVAFSNSNSGGRQATLDLLLVMFDAKGKAVHQLGRNLELKPDRTQYDQLLKTGIDLNVESEVPAATTRARVVVHDVGSGSVGSVDLPLK